MRIVLLLCLFSLYTPPVIGQEKSETNEPNEFNKSESQFLIEVESFLKVGGDINSLDKEGFTLLEKSIRSEYNNASKFLISNGANVNAGMPLFFASARGQREIVELLILKGADINVKGSFGETPLHWAAQYGHKNVVELLLSKGADPNVTDAVGGTPLHYARKPDVIEALLVKGANINAKSSTGSTPLHSVVRDHYKILGLTIKPSKETLENNKEIVELLLRKGADINIKDKKGQTPIQLARESGDTEMVDFLKKHGATD
jgi:ankyrin repeat protein